MKTKLDTLRNFLRNHQALLLLVLAFTTLRGLSILLLRPGGFISGTGPDHDFYFEFARWAGGNKIAFFDFWMEYPPLMPWLAALAYKLSLTIPAWPTAIFGFNLMFRLLLLPFEIGTLILVWAIARRLGSPENAERTAALWALLFAPFFTFLAWFDSMAIFFLVLALYGLLTDRPALAGVALGLGFMVKIIPAVLFPIGLFTLQTHRRRFIYAGSAALSAGILILPPLLVSPDFTVAMARVFTSRSSWESVWALLEGYTGYGAVARLNTHLDPTAAGFQAHPATLPWAWITLTFGALYLFILTRVKDWRDKHTLTAFAFFSLLWFVLYSKGYSPQWASYISTMALLALPTLRGLGYALLMDLFLFGELGFGFLLLNGEPRFLTGVILLRTLLFVCLTLECLARFLPMRRFWAGVQRFAFPVMMCVFLIGGGALTVWGWNAYAARQLAADPLAPFVATWREQQKTDAPPVVVAQSALLERLSPHLGPRNVLMFPHLDGTPFEDTTTWAAGLSTRTGDLWLLYDAKHEPQAQITSELENWFAAHACKGATEQYQDIQAAHYYFPLQTTVAQEIRFEEPVRFIGSTGLPEALRPGESLCLRFVWMADAAIAEDYGVFVHLVAANGANGPVAQADAWPQVPTHAWATGAESLSMHLLTLSPSLAPGKYTLRVGLYRVLANNTRLPLADGNDAFELGQLTITPN
ncbi:MAG: DUF2029 domain-containing protein [Anaerolineae bacterium]|nr:DUF2029 domain-containing protein [Anaerolineae bacterium]